jgi:hypothetical protein
VVGAGGGGAEGKGGGGQKQPVRLANALLQEPSRSNQARLNLKTARTQDITTMKTMS